MRKYLVATHSQLILVELNDEWQITQCQSLNEGHHYGIGFLKTEDRDAVLVKQSDKEVMVLDRNTLDTISDPIPLLGKTGAVHQISYTNGGLYFTNTDYNTIVYQTLDGAVFQDYHFEDKDFDYNHINSVFPSGNQIYALLHNKGRTLTELAVMEHDPSAGFTLLHKVSLWDHGCHNAFVHDGFLFYNASSDGGFVTVDLKKDQMVRRMMYPGHTKGLSLSEGAFVIGYSEHAERSMRNQTRGYLVAIDEDTREEITRIDLNSAGLSIPVGNINEVRCISHHEFSHANPEQQYIQWADLKLGRNKMSEYLMKHVSLYVSRGYKKLVGNKKL